MSRIETSNSELVLSRRPIGDYMVFLNTVGWGRPLFLGPYPNPVAAWEDTLITINNLTAQAWSVEKLQKKSSDMTKNWVDLENAVRAELARATS